MSNIQKLIRSMSGSGIQVEEPCPILAPGYLEVRDKNGDFLVGTYDGRSFDEDGNEIFD